MGGGRYLCRGYIPWSTLPPVGSWPGGRYLGQGGRGRYLGVPFPHVILHTPLGQGGRYLGVPPPPSEPGRGEGVGTLGYLSSHWDLAGGGGGVGTFAGGTYLGVPSPLLGAGQGVGTLARGGGVGTLGYPFPMSYYIHSW